MIKSENDFDKNNILNLLNNNLGKSWQYNKNINSEVIYNKKSLNAEKDLTPKNCVQYLYTSNIVWFSLYKIRKLLFESVFWKIYSQLFFGKI